MGDERRRRQRAEVLAWSLTVNNPQRPSFNPETAPSWTPDGTSLVVASALYDTKKGPQPTVVAIPVKGGPPRRLFALPRATNAWAGVDSPQLSPNGRLIAFLYGSAGTFSLYVARPDGSHRKRLSAAHVGYGRNLDWSPDGRRIVFLRQPDPVEGGYADLYVVKADGTGLRRLTTEKVSTENLTPAWSPDGSRIIFKSGADSLATPGQADGIENRFAVINADGTDLHLVGPGHIDCGVKDPYLSHPACYASDPSWQPH